MSGLAFHLGDRVVLRGQPTLPGRVTKVERAGRVVLVVFDGFTIPEEYAPQDLEHVAPPRGRSSA